MVSGCRGSRYRNYVDFLYLAILYMVRPIRLLLQYLGGVFFPSWMANINATFDVQAHI